MRIYKCGHASISSKIPLGLYNCPRNRLHKHSRPCKGNVNIVLTT